MPIFIELEAGTILGGAASKFGEIRFNHDALSVRTSLITSDSCNIIKIILITVASKLCAFSPFAFFPQAHTFPSQS